MSLSSSARCRDILFRSKGASSYDAVRLFLEDGRWLDVECQFGGELLLKVLNLPPNIKDDIVVQLVEGSPGRQPVPIDAVDELSFKLDRRLQVGGKPLIHAFFRGSFVRVFYVQSEVADPQAIHSYTALNA